MHLGKFFNLTLKKSLRLGIGQRRCGKIGMISLELGGLNEN